MREYLQATQPDDIIFYGYLYQEKKCFGLDYNDLIKFTLYIFENQEEIKQKWQKRLEYIMIDEFQDIDDLQYQLMCVLCGFHGNLFIVGDPDQTIYTWRGANVKYLLDFHRNFPAVKTIMMMENYRSTPQILSAANSLICKNQLRMKKDLGFPPCRMETWFGVIMGQIRRRRLCGLQRRFVGLWKAATLFETLPFYIGPITLPEAWKLYL